MTYMPSFRWRQLQWRAVCEGIIRAGEPKEAINPPPPLGFPRGCVCSVCLRGVFGALRLPGHPSNIFLQNPV